MKTVGQFARYASMLIALNFTFGMVGGVIYALVTHPLHFQPWAHLLKYFWSQL
jgi:hypothetical protein